MDTGSTSGVEHLIERFDDITAQCRDTMIRKNHDYTSGSSDVLANFRSSEIIGVDAGLGILIRTLDKIKRLQTFIEKGDLKVNESADDAIQDVINYMVLLSHRLNE